jgi:acyl dehydratase
VSVSGRLYAEDLRVGEVIDLGSSTLSHDQIVAFAREWDPQPFHVDDTAAAAGFFGEVIASGLQTMGVFQRLFVDGALKDWEVIAGRRIRDVELTLAVRAGMTLHATVEILEITPIDAQRSLVTKVGTLDHEGRPVLRMETDAYVRRRPAASGMPPGQSRL